MSNIPVMTEFADGNIWMLDGSFHREDGPACDTQRVKQWFIYGKRHREDGPAIEYNGGKKLWFLHGIEYDPIEWLLKVHEIQQNKS